MGVKQSPDIAQEIMMEHILCDIDECDVYIDDIGYFYYNLEISPFQFAQGPNHHAKQ